MIINEYTSPRVGNNEFSTNCGFVFSDNQKLLRTTPSHYEP